MAEKLSPVLRSAFAACCAAAVLLSLPSTSDAQECRRFRRGDANSDGSVDLSDPVATLGYLFEAGTTPTCMDAVDSDDSGVLDITDAVFTLGYLFLGTAPPPDPGPVDCGRDFTFDELECDIQPPCVPSLETRDFAGFSRFEYAQQPGLGFCGEVGTVRTAVIAKSDAGAYHLEMSLLLEGTPGVDPCLFPGRGPPCVVDVPLTPRDLTEKEAERVREVFAIVPLFADSAEICECIAIDPCLIRNFTWDADGASDFICSAPRLEEAETAEILALLESLRPGA